MGIGFNVRVKQRAIRTETFDARAMTMWFVADHFHGDAAVGQSDACSGCAITDF